MRCGERTAIARLQLAEPLASIATQRLVAGDTLGEQQSFDPVDVLDPLDCQRLALAASAVGDRDRLIRDIVANAKVFQGGGSEVLLTSLDDRIKAATDASLVRMFPRFKEADLAAWEAVIKRAQWAHHPFQATGHTDATEKHAVCQQVVATIGAGKSGSDVRKTLGGAPVGWPRDAVDAALIALHRLQHLTATLNGQAIPLGQLDQNKIARADFRVEARNAHRRRSVLFCESSFRPSGFPARAARKPFVPANS